MDNTKLEQRLADLEVEFTHQNETIDTLNEAVINQWKEIDRLSGQVRVLSEQLLSIEDDGKPHEVTRPPHY